MKISRDPFNAAAVSAAALHIALVIALLCPASGPPDAAAANPSTRGDAETGRTAYLQCTGCHSLERNRTGPRHCGLIGRAAGALPDFAYSEAMRGSGLVWDVGTLDEFLASPTDKVPGTAMGFAGISDRKERLDLIAYLVAVNGPGGECADGS